MIQKCMRLIKIEKKNLEKHMGKSPRQTKKKRYIESGVHIIFYLKKKRKQIQGQGVKLGSVGL